MIKISMVPVEHIEHIWPAVEYYVEESLKYFPGRYTTEDIKKGLLNEPRQLWIAFEDNIAFPILLGNKEIILEKIKQYRNDNKQVLAEKAK